jgi:chromosome segregation ATPase
MLRPTFPNALHQRLRANEAVSGQVENLGERVTGLDARVTDARTTADAAKAEAGAAKTTAAEAKITANEAKTTAGEAKTESAEAKTEASEVKKDLADRVGDVPQEVTLASLQGQVNDHEHRIMNLEKRQPPYNLDRLVGSMLLNNLLNEWHDIIRHTEPDQRHQEFNESLGSNLCKNMEGFCAQHLQQDWKSISKEIGDLKKKPKKDWSQQHVDPGILTTMGTLRDIAAKLWVPV